MQETYTSGESGPLAKIVSIDKGLSLTRLLLVLLCTKSHAKQDPLPVRNGPAKSFNAQSHSDDPPATCAYALAHDIGGHPPSRNVLHYYV
jgi:hypothetical protein